MAAPSKPVPKKDAPQAATQGDGRAERLAAALRENLKRRKAQARSQVERQSAAHKTVDRGAVDIAKRNG
ncbi:hypothetical protein [Reyranella sp.]|uniref:hypothetical protein n=1 Tax=Reyranella sp. TaxID=1929291 RepID=UPI003783DF3E